ncbi:MULTISPECIES: AmpG family muropeptide MFS transporter [Hyphobacterium]|uniref:AmpG family muropeptide MFS transporter n=1 Tax=Hyphobacterium vulgare TaxID=1736751 RepID=A0ABV6ZWZ0_9PROT
MADAAVTEQRTWRDTVRVYFTPVMLSMLILGFASGLPLYMVFQKLSYWLRDSGIDRTTIGFFYWVTLSYTLKFLWAPIIDRVQVPFLHKLLGARRSWIVTAITGTVIALVIISQTDPTQGLIPVAIAAILLSYSSATLDVAIDAWRIESAPNRMQANMAAAYSLGYRVAYMTSGLGLAISEWSNWTWSFLAMAAAMALSAVLVFFMKEPAAGAGKRALEGSFGMKVVRAVWEPLRQFFALLHWWVIPVILFLMLYRMSDFTMGVMASPLYSDIGFDRAILGGIQGGPGLIATISGLFLGGVAAYRFGLMKSLAVGLVITLVTNGAYAWLAATAGPEDYWKLTIAIVGDNLAGGFVTTAFIAYMSSLVDPANAATQYALLSSFYALFAKFLSGFSGMLADAVGWVNFFIITAAWTLPAAGLLVILMMSRSKAVRGEHKFAERELADPGAKPA